MSVPTARAPADGIYPSLYLHSYSTTSLSLPSYFKNPPISSPPSFTPLSIPFCYLYPFTLYLHYLSLSLYPSTSPHSSYLSALFLPSFLSTSVLYFLTPPLFLFTLIYPPLPLYPLHLHSSISLHPSTSLPLSLFLPLATLLFLFPQSLYSSLCPLSPTSHHASSYRET